MPYIPRTIPPLRPIPDSASVPKQPKKDPALPKPPPPLKSPPVRESPGESVRPEFVDQVSLQTWDFDPMRVLQLVLPGKEIKEDEYSRLVS